MNNLSDLMLSDLAGTILKLAGCQRLQLTLTIKIDDEPAANAGSFTLNPNGVDGDIHMHDKPLAMPAVQSLLVIANNRIGNRITTERTNR